MSCQLCISLANWLASHVSFICITVPNKAFQGRQSPAHVPLPGRLCLLPRQHSCLYLTLDRSKPRCDVFPPAKAQNKGLWGLGNTAAGITESTVQTSPSCNLAVMRNLPQAPLRFLETKSHQWMTSDCSEIQTLALPLIWDFRKRYDIEDVKQVYKEPLKWSIPNKLQFKTEEK